MSKVVEGTPVESEYVLAQPNGVSVPVQNSKQGHMCCGGCCDVRRAVIIVNLVNVCFGVIGLLGIVAAQSINTENLNDDEVKAAVSTFQDGIPLGVLVAVSLAGIACNACGVFGALKYNVVLVGISMAAYCLYLLFDLMSYNIGGIVYNGLFAYPHYFLIQEIRKGIMSPQNYPNEERSCCCV